MIDPESAAPKTAAPDPEIPEEIRTQVSKKFRPAGFAPKSPEAEDDNEKEREVEAPQRVLREVRPFFKKLKAVLKKGGFTRTNLVEREVREKIAGTKDFTIHIKKVPITRDVELITGDDGLPYVVDPITAEETREIRCRSYPGAPHMGPATGDLTPEFVEWLYLNHPYDAAVRYYGRSTHVHVNPH